MPRRRLAWRSSASAASRWALASAIQLADLLRVSAGVQGGPVTGHLAGRVLDPGGGCLHGCVIGAVGLLAGHDLVDGVGQAHRGEHGGEPLVDAGVEGVLAQVDVARVADLVGQARTRRGTGTGSTERR